MRGEPRPSRRDVGPQRELWNLVIAGILRTEGDRRGRPQRVEALPERIADRREARLVDAVRPMHEERRQHVEAGVIQDAVMNRVQQVVDRPVDSARAVMRCPPARRHDQHRALAFHRALAVAIAPVRIRMLADAVREAERVHALDPALQDRRHREPPQRKLQDERVGPAQLVLLACDVGRLRAVLERMLRIERRIEARIGPACGIVVGVERRFPLHRVQIGNLHRVPGFLEMPEREILQRAVQRFRLGMGIDQQDVHIGRIDGLTGEVNAGYRLLGYIGN